MPLADEQKAVGVFQIDITNLRPALVNCGHKSRVGPGLCPVEPAESLFKPAFLLQRAGQVYLLVRDQPFHQGQQPSGTAHFTMPRILIQESAQVLLGGHVITGVQVPLGPVSGGGTTT
ncbi:hypothetical protein ES707_15841 [subsurface metagenome]